MSKTPAQRARKHGERAATPSVPSSGSGRGSTANLTTNRSPEQAQGNATLIIIAGLGVSVFMFWYLHLLALDQMTQLSDGLPMPDALVGGFSAEQIERLRAAMDEDARGQLSYVHRTAGTIFPLVFGFTALLAVGSWVRSRPIRWAAFTLVAAFVVARLWGNVAVDSALTPGAGAGEAGLASVLVVTGWALLVVILLGGAAAGLLTRRARRASPGA